MGPQEQKRHDGLRRVLAVVVLGASAATMTAEDLPWGIPQDRFSWWHYVPFPQVDYLAANAEMRQSSYKARTGATTTWEEAVLTSSLRLTWQSYIYNPYLLSYTLALEPEYRWQRYAVSGRSSKTKEWVLNGRATATVLSVKPYTTSFTVSRTHQDVQADFFNSQNMDLQSWGVQTGYREGAVPVTLTFERSEEDRTGNHQEFVTNQLKLNLHAKNDRKNGDITVLDYQFNRYQNQSLGGSGSYARESRSHHAQLTDVERFKKSTLSSMLNFSELEASGLATSSMNAFFNYNLGLTPHLSNYYTYSVGNSFSDGYNAWQNSVTAGLTHQLYESLSSNLSFRGSTTDNQSTGAALRSSSYGTGVAVSYNKHLGTWGNLAVNTSASLDLFDQQSSGGALTIPDESYTIPTTGPMLIRLKTPNVVSITSITKNNVPLDADEWRTITSSDPWQVQFFGAGAHAVKNGDPIVVTYVVRPNPSGTYSTRMVANEIALRFWHDLVGVRASYVTTVNHADSSQFVLQNVTQYLLGADVGWHGMQGNASYLHVRSTLYAYDSFTLSESYSRQLSSRSTMGINFYQQWAKYPTFSGSNQQAQDLTFYSYTLRYGWNPTDRININAEAGLQQQHGNLVDERQFAARIYVNWKLGKLEIHLGYENEDNQYVSDTYRRHYTFLKMRRIF